MEGTTGQKIKAASHLVRGHLGVNRVASKDQDQANLLISSFLQINDYRQDLLGLSMPHQPV